MTEPQTASTEVTIEGLPDLFDKQKAYFAKLAHPWRARYALLLYRRPNGYIDYPEFSRSESGS